MEIRAGSELGDHRAPASARALRAWPADTRTVFVIGAAGGGKTEFARRWATAAGGRIARVTPDWATADRMRRRTAAAARGRPPLLVLDDAQHVMGTDAERALQSLVTAPPVPRLVIASRTPPSFELRPDALVTVVDLTLDLADVVAMFRERGGRRIDLEAAARVSRETVGWPELVRRLAMAPGPADEAFALALAANLGGDSAASWLEESLRPLPPALVSALATVAVLPGIDLARATPLLGPADATALIAALDCGLVMHARDHGGRRTLPPMLRRHVLDRMPQADRRAAADRAADLLLECGDEPDAANALAAGACWTGLARLLAARPDAARRASLWVDAVPAHVVSRVPAIAAAAERARREDRESVHLAAVAAPGAPRSPGSPDAPFAIAVRLLAQGDVTGSVPWFRRSVVAPGSRRTPLLARLALAVIRAPLADPDATTDLLEGIERDARDEGLDGLARVVRGAIATTGADRERSSVRAVVEQFEARGDLDGALVVEALDVLAQVRHGTPDLDRALGVAGRAEALGLPQLAAWSRTAAALAAAASHAPRRTELAASARASAMTTGLTAADAVLDAAAAFDAPASARPRRLASSRRAALECGLPRVPLPRRIESEDIAPLTATERCARLEVACFGAFRLRLDGTEADLHGIRPQARAVLRMLALNAGSPLHRDLIASLLWGELSTDSALHALHVSVSSLRRMLPAEADGGIVERVGEAYRIGIADRRDCDLAAFDDHLAEAAEAKLRGDATAARDGLVSALDLYVGEVLPEDGPAEWAVGARERYRLRAAEAANALAHLHSRLEDPRAAVVAAHRAVEIDPWVDESWRTLIAMHRRAGDVIAGRRAEDGYRGMRRALGVD